MLQSMGSQRVEHDLATEQQHSMDVKVVFLLLTVNNATMNMGGQIALEILISIRLGVLEVRLLDLMVVLFSIFLRKLYAVFHSDYPVIHSLWVSS